MDKHAFHGKWITNASFADAIPINVFHRQLDKVDLPKTPLNQHILFRKTFEVHDPRRARLFITADDYYKVYLNGRYVGQGPCPGYHFHYYYNTYDVSDLLHSGKNTIAVHTYYQGLINRVWVSGDNRHGLLLDLICNGKTVLKSDSCFLCKTHSGYTSNGVSGYQTQFMENYNCLSAEVGFEQPSFDDSNWPAAHVRQNIDYEVFPQPTKNLVIETVRPITIDDIPGGFQVDFGGMYVGTLTALAKGAQGSSIRIRCAQELTDDGSLRHRLRANSLYEENWLLSGEKDRLEQFDYKSFRYAEFKLSSDCELDKSSIRLLARHYPFTEHAKCASDDRSHQQIWALCIRSLHYGVQETIQDCMEREKGQYLGDGCYSALSHALASGDLGIMEKLIEDSLRSRFINKGLMTCSTCSFMQEIAEYPLMLPLLVRSHYHLAKDDKALRRWFPLMAEMLDFYRDSYEDERGLLMNLDKWSVVDWPASYRDGYDFDLTEGQVNPGTHNVINAYYIGAIKVMNALARILGLPAYRNPSALQESYVHYFYDPKRKVFVDSPSSNHVSIPGNAIALMYDLCPDKQTEMNIVTMYKKKRLTSSMFFMTYPILFGLRRIGEKELTYQLIKDEEAWPRMLREGATSTFEGWGKDTKWNTSLFHLTLVYAIVFLTEWGIEETMDFQIIE